MLSERTRAILGLIAEGRSYDQILQQHPELTYFDIFAAAREALELTPAVPSPPSLEEVQPADEPRRPRPTPEAGTHVEGLSPPSPTPVVIPLSESSQPSNLPLHLGADESPAEPIPLPDASPKIGRAHV